MSRIVLILALGAFALPAQAQKGSGTVDATKARQIGCAAIRAKYEGAAKKCAALGVERADGVWRVYEKCDPHQRLCGGADALVSPETGKILRVSYTAQ